MNKKYTLLFKMKVLNIYISLHKYIHRGYKFPRFVPGNVEFYLDGYLGRQ